MKLVPATFDNATFVTVVKPKTKGGKYELLPIKPELQPRHAISGQPVFGPNVRRLLNVKEIADKHNISLNEAKRWRDNLPFEFLLPPDDYLGFWNVNVRQKEDKKKVA